MIILNTPETINRLIPELLEQSLYQVFVSHSSGNPWHVSYLKVGYDNGSYSALLSSDGSAVELNEKDRNTIKVCAYKLLAQDIETPDEVRQRHGLCPKN